MADDKEDKNLSFNKPARLVVAHDDKEALPLDKEELAELRKAAPAPASSPAAPAPTVFIADHTLGSDETLSHLALKYYGHATPAYWKLIYEANKDVVGENPNRVRPGMVLKIPALPAELKE